MGSRAFEAGTSVSSGSFVLERRDALGAARPAGSDDRLADLQARLVRAAAREVDCLVMRDGAPRAAAIVSRLGAVVVDLDQPRIVSVYRIRATAPVWKSKL